MQKTGNMGGRLKISIKNSFKSPIFFIYNVIGPLNFTKLNFGIKIHFLILFWFEERDEVVELWLRERKCMLVRNSATKKVVLCQMVPYDTRS